MNAERGTAVDAQSKARRPATTGAELRSASRRSWRTVLLLLPPTLWMVVAVLVPVLMILWVSMWRVEGASLIRGFGVSTWGEALTSSTTWSVALRTVYTFAIVISACTLLGLRCGYFLARYVRKPRTQALLLMLAILPFWTSYIIRIITWQPLLGEKGILNWVLLKLGVIDVPSSAFLFNQWAMMLVMIPLYVVFVIGPVYWGFGRISPDILAAARDLGAKPWRAFWTIELPLAKGGVIAGAFFASVFLFGDYATERIINGGKNPALSGTVKGFASMGQWPIASVLAVLLLVLVVITLALFMRVHDLRREL